MSESTGEGVRLYIPSEILLGFASNCFAVRLALLAQDDTDDDDADGDDTDGDDTDGDDADGSCHRASLCGWALFDAFVIQRRNRQKRSDK